MGVFLESCTGFAVGTVFAPLGAAWMGVGGAVAGALAMQALVLVPWGGLGPGTALGAALTGLPAQALSMAAAWLTAAWLLLLGAAALVAAGPGRRAGAGAGTRVQAGDAGDAGGLLLASRGLGCPSSSPDPGLAAR